MDKTLIDQKVLLKRVKMFYGHAVGNVINLLIASLFVSIILSISGIINQTLYLWNGLVVLCAMCIFFIEFLFKKAKLTKHNVLLWLWLRMSFGALASLLFGLSAFLFPQEVATQYEMYVFIILITIVSLTMSSYAIVLKYSIIVLTTTLLPFTIYLLTKQGDFYLILAMTAIIIQIILVIKAIQISKSASKSLYLNEQLLDEIDDHKATKKTLNHMVNHDLLTGLPNRHFLMEKLNCFIKENRENNPSMAVMYIDLDGFKAVNDTYGHDAGDIVLKEVANRILTLDEKFDVVARIGGDEFVIVIICPDSVQLKAIKLKKQLIEILTAPYYVDGKNSGIIGASIGIAINNNNNDTTESLLKAADVEMYKNKKPKLTNIL